MIQQSAITSSKSNQLYQSEMMTLQTTTLTQTVMFAAAVKMLRKASNVDQKDLARRLGISQPQLSQIEAGRYVPVARLTFLIEDELGIVDGSLSALLGYQRTTIQQSDAFELIIEEAKRRETNG